MTTTSAVATAVAAAGLSWSGISRSACEAWFEPEPQMVVKRSTTRRRRSSRSMPTCHPPLICEDTDVLLELPADPSFLDNFWSWNFIVCVFCILFGFWCGRRRPRSAENSEEEEEDSEEVVALSPRRRRHGGGEESEGSETADTADTDGRDVSSIDGASEEDDDLVGYYKVGGIAVPLTVGLSRTTTTLLTVAPGTVVHVQEVEEEVSRDRITRLRGRVAYPAAGWISLRTADCKHHWASKTEAPEAASPLQESLDESTPKSSQAQESERESELSFSNRYQAMASTILGTADLQELLSLEPCRTTEFSLWMLWVAQRLHLNDDSLETLDLRGWPLPEDPDVAERLMAGLATNTRLRTLRLSRSQFGGSMQARALASALEENTALEVLELESNQLGPSDLQEIFRTLGTNQTLRVLRCDNQFSEEQPGLPVFAEAAKALEKNYSLTTFGYQIPVHFRHQLAVITKALTRNQDRVREARRSEQLKRAREESIRRSSEWIRTRSSSRSARSSTATSTRSSF